MRRLALVTALVCRVAWADPPDKVRADKLFDDGRKYLQNKEYQLACTAFEESQKIDPAIGTALNIALCYEEWGHVAAAYKAFVEAERLAQAKHDDRVKGARKKIDELGPKVPHLTIHVPADADPSAVYVFDGKLTERSALVDGMPVEIGHHDVEVRVPGQPPATTGIDIKIGEMKEITLVVPKPVVAPPVVKVVVETGPRNTTRLYGGLGTGVAGVVAIGVAGLVALKARDDYDAAIVHCSDSNACMNKADFDATSNARTRANEMSFVAGGGVVLVGVGIYLMATSGGKKIEKQAIAPMVGPHAAGIALGGGF